MSSSDEDERRAFEGSSSDEENAYFHRGLGSSRRRRKEREDARATYGVFGEEEVSSDEDGRGGGGRGGRGGAPFVGFVRGAGFAEEEEEEEREDVLDALDASGRAGLGGLGLGAAQARPSSSLRPQEEEEPLTSFGRRVRKQADKRREEEYGKGDEKRGGGSSHGQRHDLTALHHKRSQTVGQFEAHTKGIGAKLLGKMGWKQGQGLGKGGSGLAEPLQATLRPKGMGMGFGNRREPSLKSALDEREEREEKERERLKKEQHKEHRQDADVIHDEAKMWRKSRAEARLKEKGPKEIFKTVDEVLKSAEGTTQSTVQTIIDMRGPQQRVVQSDKLDAHSHARDAEGPMPELQHNMRLLVDMTETEIKKVNARIRHAKDTKKLLEKEEVRLGREKAHAETQRAAAARAVDVMRALRNRVVRGNAIGSNHMDSLHELRKAFETAKAGLLDEVYYGQRVHVLAGAAVRPSLAEIVRGGWSPLESKRLKNADGLEVDSLATTFADWKPLLMPSGEAKGGNTNDNAYEALITEIVFPSVSREIQAMWNPKQDDAHRLNAFLESWKGVLPTSTVDYIAQHLVMPKLLLAVQQWDPLTDPLAPHTWLFPWLPYLGELLDVQLWPTVRQKFSAALTRWHPSDPSALAVMAPWTRAFRRTDWNHLCATSIEPKLVRVLTAKGLVRFDHREALEWVTAWSGVLDDGRDGRDGLDVRDVRDVRDGPGDNGGADSRLARLLKKHFYPHWRTELRRRLTGAAPNFPEIAAWWRGWRDVVAADMNVACLEAMVDDMDRTMRGEELDRFVVDDDPNGERGETSKPPRRRPKVADRTPQSLKDLVAQFAEDSGVEFLPSFGKTHAGLQIWNFGLAPCVINAAREEILCLHKTTGDWKHVSLDELLEENDARLSGTV